MNGIPDFYVAESGHDFSTDPNIVWLEPRIANARETIYRLCARELTGMAFCMDEIGRRTSSECRILEVGMGTGHFTRWLAQVSEPGTAIYAFDFSWPMIEKARARITGWPGVSLFRANAREGLPFQAGVFDIILIRLAPLGPRGVPNVEAGFGLLKPGGWYFWAGWANPFETPPTEWAIQHGYSRAEYHEWQYRRVQSEEERVARQIERQLFEAMQESRKAIDASERIDSDSRCDQGGGRDVLTMTQEHVLIAQKPVGSGDRAQ